MASVIRLNSGGSTTVEEIELSLEQAKEFAARLREAGEPGGCAWCVRLDEEEEEESGCEETLNAYPAFEHDLSSHGNRVCPSLV